jgi:hypothetical protein
MKPSVGPRLCILWPFPIGPSTGEGENRDKARLPRGQVYLHALEKRLAFLAAGNVIEMRKLLLLLFCAAIALPAYAARRVTMQQFEKVVASVHGRPDGDAADMFSQLELTERLSSARAARFKESLPGPRAKGALLILADASAFLPLPADETLSDPTPDPVVLRALIDSATQYASQTLSKLPNFFATRQTILFMDAPPKPQTRSVPADQWLLFAARSNATVLYREGKQVVESEDRRGKKSDEPGSGLVVSGEFGPILGTVLADAQHGELTWSHWEQIDQTKAAVFRYSVSKDKSHYEAGFCCVAMSSGRGVFKRLTAYHGEIAVDPDTGTILRVSMQADLKPAYPLARADLMVEYGPVEIGGKTYICPSKSVAIARGYEPVQPDARKQMLGFGPESVEDAQTRGTETLQTMLDDVVFRDYHLFRSETRILTDGDQGPDANPQGSKPPIDPSPTPQH